MLRSVLLLFTGNAFASLILLARNLLVARLLSVEDYGVASTFALAMAIVEMASDFGLKQQIVQSEVGDDASFQNALQGFQILRGAVSAGLMFIIAPVLAGFLGIPEVVWAYQVLAVVPLINAFVHFDIHRLNREMRFAPMILAQGVPAFASVLMIWPLVALLGDWRSMLWSVIAQSILTVAVSFVFAERPFRPRLDRKVMSASLRFGWPLLVNAILLFLVFQGDKLVVGRASGIEALALFSMGITLTLTPTLVVAKSFQNLFLPVLSRRSGEQFIEASNLLLQLNPLAVIYFIGSAAAIGPWFVTVVLGAKYASLAHSFGWYAVGQGLRLLKAGPGVIALSRGNTANAMLANVVRVAVIPVAWVVLERGYGIEWLLVIIAVGEAMGVIVAYALIRKHSVKADPLIWGALVLTVGAVAMGQQYVAFAVSAVSLLLLLRVKKQLRILKR